MASNNGAGKNIDYAGAKGLFDEVRSYFDVDGITIEAGGSRWSGREYVRVEGRVVSERRSIGFSSRHRFSHGGHAYEVLFSIQSMAGRMLVLLYRDGSVVDSDIVEQPPLNLVKAAALGALVGCMLIFAVEFLGNQIQVLR
jgi:hypothetical protein